MSAPPWGHKPPPVANFEEHWSSAPDQPSERAAYWIRRLREGSWLPNRWLRRECSDCQARILGVWIWEVWQVFIPLEQALAGMPPESIAAGAALWCGGSPGPYWEALEERSRPEDRREQP